MPNATRDYKLISADGHLNEPGDLWTSRVPKEFKDRVPYIKRFEKGDAWVMEGVDGVRPFGWGACAGRPPEELGEWAFFEEINKGSYDPVARVEELDRDGVDAELIFASGVIAWVNGERDPDLHHAMVRAYNDFLSEFCAHAPDRLGGAALLPNRGTDEVLAELERLESMPGFVAYYMKALPDGGTSGIKADYDRVWQAILETGKPLAVHIGFTDSPGVGKPVEAVGGAKKLPGTGHFYDAPKLMLEFIFEGVFDRFPELEIILAETDCGWMPYFQEQADDNYLRHAQADLKDNKLAMLPSEYMIKHFPASFITDHSAIANREKVGVDRMLWSNDHPHITSDWPNSWKTINASMANVPADERHKILAGNAQRLLKFGS